jgi:repressor LexA
MREATKAMGYKSVGSVHHQLHQLHRMGYIRIDPTQARALEVLRGVDGLTSLEASSEQVVQVPILGEIAAGVPILAEEAIAGTFALPRELVGFGELFVLHVKGDSMRDAAILDGDFIVVRQQSVAESGQIVAAMIDGEATVKVLKLDADGSWLLPRNPNYAPIPADEASILGVVVSVMRSL